MFMNCPKCGCKMRKQIICPYCKITGEEVKFASNKEAKKRIKNKNTEEVYISSYIPYDVDKKKLSIITVLGGFWGFDAYYLGRRRYAIIKFGIIALTFYCFIMSHFLNYTFFDTPTEILAFICAIFVFMWFGSMFGLLFNKAKVPIVLPDKDQLKQRMEEREEQIKEKERQKEEKAKKEFDKKVAKEQKKMEKKTRKKRNE